MVFRYQWIPVRTEIQEAKEYLMFSPVAPCTFQLTVHGEIHQFGIVTSQYRKKDGWFTRKNEDEQKFIIVSSVRFSYA